MNRFNLVHRICGPTEMKMELSRKCPLFCLHCSAKAGPSEQLEIPFDEAGSLIRQFAGLGGKNVIFTGGEPLGYPFLLKLIALAKQVGLQTGIYTTGIKSNFSMAADDLTSIMDYVDSFLFCFHGSNPTIHDQITGVPGSFVATRSAVRLLTERGKFVFIHHVPFLPNVGEILPLCEMIMNLGLNNLKILRFVPQGRGDQNIKKLLLDDLGNRKLAEDIHFARIRFPSLRVHIGAPHAMLLSHARVGCGAGVRTLSVGANLDGYPCDGLKEVGAGIFREPIFPRTLAEWWEQSVALTMIRSMRQSYKQAQCNCVAQNLLSQNWINNVRNVNATEMMCFDSVS